MITVIKNGSTFRSNYLSMIGAAFLGLAIVTISDSRTLKNGTKKYKKRKILQGNRIEHPDYIQEKGEKIDYSFYISNQIMNPVKQVLDLEKDKEETNKLFEEFIQ